MRIYVTGYQGRLGQELVKRGCEPLICDVTDQESILEALGQTFPDVIINCAAITDVDACEKDEGYDKAFKVNVRGVHNLIDAFSGKIIQISSDYVFDGKHGPYKENDLSFDVLPNPINGYGWSKFGAEAIIDIYSRRENIKIVRTTGLYGGCSQLSDFSNLIIDTLLQGKSIDVTRTLRSNQTYIPHLVDGLMKLIELDDIKHPIVHIASKEVISRYEFALMIATMFDLDKSFIHPVDKVEGWIAKRPIKAGLRVGLANRMGIPIYSIVDGLKALKKEMIK